MRFDAYAGNVSGTTAEDVATMVSWALKARVERARPRGRYSDVFEVKDGAMSLGWVARDAYLDTAYFEFKGVGTPAASSAIRKHWPEKHNVSRLDSCEDYDGAEVLDRLVCLVDECKDPRVKAKAIVPRGSDDGATYYWGASTSRVMVRVYEAGKMKDRLHYGRPNWVRAEAQVRPGKSMEKQLAAHISPLDAWGFSGWSRRAAERLAECEVQRFTPAADAPTFDKTTLYLARQFRRHLVEMLADFGDWECLGREIEAIWTADDLLKQQPEPLPPG
jgi:hypothetical protein